MAACARLDQFAVVVGAAGGPVADLLDVGRDAPLRVERAAFSAATDFVDQIEEGRFQPSQFGRLTSDRRSKSVQTLLGIELIDVPPPVTQAL